jgi:hypothetical protein
MAENIQDKAMAAVRRAIGEERKVHQCTAFEDSLGKSVTVRYEGVTETAAAQYEAVQVLLALKYAGFHAYQVRLFVTDADGKNMGSIEVEPPYFGVIAFETVGNKWRGTRPKDFNPDKVKPLDIIEEVAELPKDFFTRVSGVFRQFYGEKRVDDGIAFADPTPNPSPVDGEGNINKDEPDVE